MRCERREEDISFCFIFDLNLKQQPMTKRFFILFFIAGMLNIQNAISQSNPKTDQLVAALPSTGPAGYEKSELNLNSEPGSPAMAGIDYSKPDVNISITITDFKGFMDAVGDTYKAQYENEKAVTVKGKYPGKETLTKSGDFCGGADKVFLVKDRYLVVISTMSMCDFAVLNQLIDKMNLEKLQ